MKFTPKSPLHREFIGFMEHSRNQFYRRYPNFRKDKLIGYQLVKDIVGCPQIYHMLSNINLLTTEILNNIPANNFVIKATKGRQANRVICINRKFISENHQYRDLMRSDIWYSDIDFIKYIRDIIPSNVSSFKIIIEEFIGDGISIPLDYKIYVVRGKTKLIGLYSRGKTQKNFRSLFYPDWTPLPKSEFYISPKFPDAPSLLEIPELASIEIRNKLPELAEKLAKKLGTQICRFDFYCVGDKIYFGEITLICGGLAYHTLKPMALELMFPLEIRKWYRKKLLLN